MIPIHELLSRIRWDNHFNGDFVLGYYDRIRDEIVYVPFADISFPAGDHFSFELIDNDGMLHAVPFHRVREVLRDGKRIWHREH